jgi:hypothetical protein
MARKLSRREKQAYRDGGFCLTPRHRRAGEAERRDLLLARSILKAWGLGAADRRVCLAIASPRIEAAYSRGDGLISYETLERITIVLALSHHLAYAKPPDSRPVLPAVKRAGRPALEPQVLLKRGRLCDLLALWRQVVLDEETAAQRRAGKRRSKERSRSGS